MDLPSVSCPWCGSEKIDGDEGYTDHYSYGGGVRSEGHYTTSSGTWDLVCLICECEFTAIDEGDGEGGCYWVTEMETKGECDGAA